MEGIDFDETFAPTMRFESLQLLFAIATQLGLMVHQMDVDNAYLNTALKDKIYMTVPPGYEVAGDKVLRLQKSLYGLKQSAQIWNQRLKDAINHMDFNAISADKCIYIRAVGEHITIIGLYVDDILILAKMQAIMEETKAGIKKALKVKDTGPVNRILRIQVHRRGNLIMLEQTQYARKILLEYGMDQYTTVATPLDGYEAIKAAGPNEKQSDERQYQQQIGSLMYLMKGTRSDLTFAVGKLSQFSTDPTVRHANAVTRVLRYVVGTTDLGICFKSNGDAVAYSDSAYGDDKKDCKSTYGHVLMYSQGPCVWTSKKKRSVATSTTEAEYVALTKASKVVVWTTRWLQEVQVRDLKDNPICLLDDNKDSLDLTKNPEHHQQTKHINIQHHYIRQVVADHAVDIVFVPKEDQIADVLTKPLARPAFEQERHMLGVYALIDMH